MHKIMLINIIFGIGNENEICKNKDAEKCVGWKTVPKGLGKTMVG